MSTVEPVPAKRITIGHVLRLLLSLALITFGVWALWQDIAGGWSKQLDYFTVFGDPYGPTGPLSPVANLTQHVAHAVGAGFSAIIGFGGMTYHLLALRAPRHRVQ